MDVANRHLTVEFVNQSALRTSTHPEDETLQSDRMEFAERLGMETLHIIKRSYVSLKTGLVMVIICLVLTYGLFLFIYNFQSTFICVCQPVVAVACISIQFWKLYIPLTRQPFLNLVLRQLLYIMPFPVLLFLLLFLLLF